MLFAVEKKTRAVEKVVIVEKTAFEMLFFIPY